VIATPSAMVGNIGVIGVHNDQTEADAKAGLKRTVISAGKYKAEGVGPLTDEARGAMQSMVDQMYAMFVADVAAGRGTTATAVRNGYGEGRVLFPADALKAGLIDRIATLDDVVAELTAAQPPGRQRLRAHSETRLAASLGGVLTSGTVAESTGASTETAIRLVPVEAPASTQPSPSAPQAKEKTVSDTPTVVPGATNAELATVQAEMARRDSIAQLCQLAGASLSDMNTFIASGKPADQVRQELATRVRPATPTPSVTGMVDRDASKPFASLGEQLKAIANHGMGLGTDKRLLQLNAALSSGAASANVPSDGAFQIQQDFSVDLTKNAFGEGTLAGDCSKTEVSGTSDGLRVMYLEETSRATGSRWGGVQVYRGAEGDSPTAKKPQFGEWERRVYDIIGAAKVSERLLDDTTALGSVLSESFSTEFDFVVDDEIIRGTGAGQCLGVLNSPALVSVAKESGQVADTVVAENIIKMWSRLLPRAKASAKWYINQEIEQQLQVMQIGTGASGQLVYMPPGGLTGSPFGTIYGRPVQVVEQCSAPGDVGDIILASLSGYKLITKGGLQSDDSIHVAFLTHERTFRWLTRVGGAPKLKSALTPYKGSNTLSDHVVLAAR
jgi:HK97 family phage major capsid protein